MPNERKKRIFIHSIIFATLVLVLAILLRDSKDGAAVFTILIAAYAATIASTGASKCFRRSRPDSNSESASPRDGA